MRNYKALIGAILFAGLLTACGTAVATDDLDTQDTTTTTEAVTTTEAPTTTSTTQATTTTTETAVSADLMEDLMEANCAALDAGMPVSELVALSEGTLLDADTSMVDVLTLVSISVSAYCPSYIDAVSTVVVYEYPEYADAVLAQVEDFIS